MKKFHIIIKDIKTGEILHDTDTDAIIGAIHEEDKTAGICFTECNGEAMVETISATKKVLKEIVSKNPMLKLIDMLEKFTENN
jgi:hypothetical protein